jgi:hypothetical protein
LLAIFRPEAGVARVGHLHAQALSPCRGTRQRDGEHVIAVRVDQRGAVGRDAADRHALAGRGIAADEVEAERGLTIAREQHVDGRRAGDVVVAVLQLEREGVVLHIHAQVPGIGVGVGGRRSQRKGQKQGEKSHPGPPF